MSLTDLREEIDSIDTQLVELLARRQKITSKVGAYKKTIGKAIYDPVREAELISERRTLAESLSVSPDLIEDLLRRIMRESYQSQHNSYRCLLPNTKVVVVGGAGALGSRFVDMFNRSGYEVVVFEESDWPNAEATFSGAKLVIISVPIQVTESVIAQLPKLDEECILADLTSLKHQPLQAMLDQHNGPVVGLHPMFGPDVPNFVKQVVVVCNGRDEHRYQWLIEQLKLWGAILEVDQAKQHDSSMEIIQAMRHFTTYVYGRFLAKQDPNLDQLLRLSSPIYRLELAMTGRLFAQNSQLYADIIYSAEDIETLAESFCSELTSALKDLKNKDKEAFQQSFEGVANWFGDTSSQFLIESRTMLKTAHDAKSVKQLSSK